MGTKEKLLLLLEENKGAFYSGEEIAERFQISRTAVWKAVKALRADGYEIQAVQNRGYCLAERSDVLTEQGIRRCLKPAYSDLELEVLASAGSTNRLLRQRAAAGAPEGTVIVAGAQTQGRGRLGRSFYSPPETGVYLSLLLRPVGFTPDRAIRITTMAAVAACEAMAAVAGIAPRIKWVNDIFWNDRKVSGILTEGSFDMESGSMDSVILGIGINVYAPADGFPEELAGIAGAIWEDRETDGKNRLAAAFLNCFLDRYAAGDFGAYAEEYRARSLVIGKQIDVLLPTGTRLATALDVDSDCRLIVRYEDGTITALSSAEVSIRVE